MHPDADIQPHFGRPNRTMARVVHQALILFNRGDQNAAIDLLKRQGIPLNVVERVILRRGPRRRSNSQFGALSDKG